MGRGSCSIPTSDDNITVVRSKDTKLVHTIFTYAGAISEDTTMIGKIEKELKLPDLLVYKNIINSWVGWT